jgi:radical SAM enzyme (TIGR01210 family)
MIEKNDLRISLMKGGSGNIWDQKEKRIVSTFTIYIPFGCPDWGEKGKNCSFCSIPLSVKFYRQEFYGGAEIPAGDHVELFSKTLEDVLIEKFHTLIVFNAGSFLAMPLEIQQAVIEKVARVSFIKRLVIESRAELITVQAVKFLTDLLRHSQKQLTIRIGVETQDDELRLKRLKKGHTRQQLFKAVDILNQFGVISGGYALLNPCPGLDEKWAVKEAEKTIDWILGNGSGQLGMKECYFSSANVGVGSPLAIAWEKGRFKPATLWMVLKVLQYGVSRYGSRLHLSSFKDEPPFLAIPSNHKPTGIPQDLSEAQGCDLKFYDIFDSYRQTMDSRVLVPPACECRPDWF